MERPFNENPELPDLDTWTLVWCNDLGVYTRLWVSIRVYGLIADMRKTGSTGSTACVIFLEAV